MNLHKYLLRTIPMALVVTIFCLALLPAAGQSASEQKMPWMNPSLSPDERAALVLKEMTLDEKGHSLAWNGYGGPGPHEPTVRGIERRCRVRCGHSAPGDSRHSDVGRSVRCAKQRRKTAATQQLYLTILPARLVGIWMRPTNMAD